MANFFDIFKKKNHKENADKFNKKITPVLFVIDTSSNMGNASMQKVNNAMKFFLLKMQEANQHSIDKRYQYRVLTFDFEFHWHTEQLTEPKENEWKDLVSDGFGDFYSAIDGVYSFFVDENSLGIKEDDTYAKQIVLFISATELDFANENNLVTELINKLNEVEAYSSAKKYGFAMNSYKAKSGFFRIGLNSDNVEYLDDSNFSRLSDFWYRICRLQSLHVESYSSGGYQASIPTPRNTFDADEFCSSSFFDRRDFVYDADSVCTSVRTKDRYFDADESCNTCMLMDNDPPKYILETEPVKVSEVQFSAVAPKQIVKGEYAMIDITVYEEQYRNIVDRIIANADEEVKEVLGGWQNVMENTQIRIVLASPDIRVEDCEETQEWKGKYLIFNFPVEIPEDYAKKQILFIASVYLNDVIATKLKFIVKCTSEEQQQLEILREDICKAFISYASQDRAKVATIIQGMKKARPDMDIFFDVESLRSGEYWEKALRREIEARDVLFLCWSNSAKNSEWVEKEWRYALETKGLDAIEPIPLETPVECPPPEELNEKHFNDRALLYR